MKGAHRHPGTGAVRATWLAALITVVFTVLVVACTGAGSTADRAAPEDTSVAPLRGGSLVVGTSSEVDGFNPLISQWSAPGFEIARAVLDPLVVMDRDGNWQPYLAKAFVPNDDFTSWTIELRPGVRFHNGEPLDADALIVYLDGVVASPLASVSLPERPTITKLDELTVQVGFIRPWSSMPLTFADQPGYVIAPEQVRSGDTRHPIGTGPFVFEEWVPDRSFKAVRNPDYWREGLPYVDRIEFRPMPDPTTRFNALRTGEIQVAEANGTGARDLDALAVEGLRVVDDVDMTGTHVLLMNLDAPPTDDLRVRQAIVEGIDREAFRAVLFDESFPIVSEPYPEDNRWYADNGYPTFDPDHARELVAAYEADHGPLLLQILTIAAGNALRPVEYLKEALAGVGIEVEIVGLETVSFVQRFVGGDYQAVYLGGFFGYADPDGMYHFLVSSNADPDKPIKLNFTRHRSEVVDEALVAQRRTADPTLRAQEWAKVWRAFATDLPYAFLIQDRSAYVTVANVHGFTGFTAPDGAPLPAINRWTPFFTSVFIAR